MPAPAGRPIRESRTASEGGITLPADLTPLEGRLVVRAGPAVVVAPCLVVPCAPGATARPATTMAPSIHGGLGVNRGINVLFSTVVVVALCLHPGSKDTAGPGGPAHRSRPVHAVGRLTAPRRRRETVTDPQLRLVCNEFVPTVPYPQRTTRVTPERLQALS
jgi:hypothetical protein